MTDPFNTGPISEPILSPAGGIVAPRRNPYVARPMNPMLSPYQTQFRQATGPMVYPQIGNLYMNQVGRANMSSSPWSTGPRHRRCPVCANSPYYPMRPIGGGMMNPYGPPRPPMGPYGRPPMGPYGGPPMGPPPMAPMGPPPMNPMGPPPLRPFF